MDVSDKQNIPESKDMKEIIDRAVEDSVVTDEEQREIVDSVLTHPKLTKSPIYKLLEFCFYFIDQLLSFFGNQALRTIFTMLNLSSISFLFSFVSGLFIGHISNRLAYRRYEAVKKELDLPFSFMNRFLYVRYSAMYSLALNILFYLIVFLIENLL